MQSYVTWLLRAVVTGEIGMLSASTVCIYIYTHYIQVPLRVLINKDSSAPGKDLQGDSVSKQTQTNQVLEQVPIW